MYTPETDPTAQYLKQFNPEEYQAYISRKRAEGTEQSLFSAAAGIPVNKGLDAPRGMISSAIDFISRPNYAAASFFNTMITEEGNVLHKTWEALKDAGTELAGPEKRLLFKNVLTSANPTWVNANPGKAATLGFIADVVLDPLNLVSFGSGGLFRKSASVVARNTGEIVALSKTGEKFFKRLPNIFGEVGEKIFNKLDPTRVVEEIISPARVAAHTPSSAERKIIEANLRFNVVNAMDSGNTLGEGAAKLAGGESSWGVFRYDYADLHNRELLASKGNGKVNFVKNERVQAKIERDALYQKKPAQRMLEEFGTETPIMKIDTLEEIRKGKELTDYSPRSAGSFESPVAVLVPVNPGKKQVRNYYRARDGKGSLLSIYAEGALDPNDLRYMVPDSGEIFTLKELDNYMNVKKLAEVEKTKQLATTQLAGRRALEKAGLKVEDLIDQGGLKILGKSVITGEEFADFFNKVGGTSAMQAIKELPGVPQLTALVTDLRNTLGLTGVLEKHAPQWMRFRHTIEAEKQQALHQLESSYHAMFGGLNKKEREEIGRFMPTIGQKTEEALETLNKTLPAEHRLQHATEHMASQVLEETLASSNLSAKQKEAIQKVMATYQDMYKLEMKAGITGDFYANYTPQRYEAISDAKRVAEYREFQTGQRIDPRTGKAATPSQDFVFSKKFKSLEEAEEFGYNPIEDAGRLYMMRYLEHHASLRQAEWKTFLEHNWGKMEDVPSAVQKDLFRLGERVWVKNHSLAGKMGIELLNKIGGIFRISATVARPAFGAKQIVSNLGQVAATLGIDTVKMFDPGVLGDAMNIAVYGKGSKFEFTTIFGKHYTPEMVDELMKQFPVTRGISIENIGTVSESKIVQQLADDTFNKTLANPELKAPAGQGLKKLWNMGLQYMNWPGKIEDFYRTSTFLTAIRAGHAPEAALEIVDKALFNYATSLTPIEKTIRTGLVPFYSFQKFGSALLAETVFKTPGRAAFLAKASPIPLGERNKEFFRVFNKVTGGEVLTESERSVAPGYLMEQPNAFVGFDRVSGVLSAKYRTFNSMAFMDVVNFAQLDQNGNFDPKATIIKGAAAQLAPWVKVPIEQLIGRKFFNDEALSGPHAGRLGDIDYDSFIRNLGAGIGVAPRGGALGAATGAAIGAAGSLPGVEKLVKWAIGWDDSQIDPVTGKKTVYVNPFKWHVASSFLPMLGSVRSISRNDRTDWDDILYMTFGIGTARVDLQKAGKSKAAAATYEYKKLAREYETYMDQGRYGIADSIQDEMTELLELNSKEMANWLDPNIRGGF